MAWWFFEVLKLPPIYLPGSDRSIRPWLTGRFCALVQVIKVQRDWGWTPGRQFGRAANGGQIRDLFRKGYNPHRGGWVQCVVGVGAVRGCAQSLSRVSALAGTATSRRRACRTARSTSLSSQVGSACPERPPSPLSACLRA